MDVVKIKSKKNYLIVLVISDGFTLKAIYKKNVATIKYF